MKCIQERRKPYQISYLLAETRNNDPVLTGKIARQIILIGTHTFSKPTNLHHAVNTHLLN